MPATPHPLRDGLVVGFLAYASVAVFYAGFDFLAARGALFTLNMLGLALFRGVRDPAILQLPIALDPSAIFWYNAVHLALSSLIGVIVVSLVDQAERYPVRRRAVVLMIGAGFFVTVAAVGLLTSSMRAVLPWWSIVVANALAVLVAGTYLLRKHRGIGRRLLSPV